MDSLTTLNLVLGIVNLAFALDSIVHRKYKSAMLNGSVAFFCILVAVI